MTVTKNKDWARVLYLIIPYIFVVGGFQFIGALIAKIDISSFDGNATTSQDLIMSFFDLIGTLLLLWVFMKSIDKEPFIELGFHLKNRFRDVLMGFIIGVFIMAIGYLILWSLNEINFETINFNGFELLMTILLFVIVAVVEEMLFRGYILKNLMSSFNKYLALIITSFLFASAHGFNPNLSILSIVGLFLGGIFLGISYVYTKNLWFPIALHFSWNLFQSLFGFNVSGIDKYSIIEFNIENNNNYQWW